MAITFQTVIGNDEVIHLPANVTVPHGPVEVTVVAQPIPMEADPEKIAKSNKDLIERLLALSAQVDWSQMPTDLAENHDHYAHGAPKGIDKE